MRIGLTITACILATIALAADGPAQIIVRRARPGSIYAELLIEVRNSSSVRLATVHMSCAVFDKSGEVLGADDGYAQNIDPGTSAYLTKLINVPDDVRPRVDNAICRVISAR